MQTLLGRGTGQREIERMTGVDRKTIRRIAREIAGAEANSPGVATGGAEIRMQDFPTWRRVFEFILQLGGEEPTAVVLDEYQFFHGDGDESVDSALAAVWEEYVNRRPKGRPLVLILCGSIVRVM